jgi:hypothetical protein
VHQIPDDVEKDLNQSAEEIQFNMGGGAQAVDEDVINAQSPGANEDFQ